MEIIIENIEKLKAFTNYITMVDDEKPFATINLANKSTSEIKYAIKCAVENNSLSSGHKLIHLNGYDMKVVADDGWESDYHVYPMWMY